MDPRNEIKTIDLAESAGIAAPEQKKYGVKPRFKNKWRNKPCPCGSGLKGKRCCAPRLIRAANGGRA